MSETTRDDPKEANCIGGGVHAQSTTDVEHSTLPLDLVCRQRVGASRSAKLNAGQGGSPRAASVLLARHLDHQRLALPDVLLY